MPVMQVVMVRNQMRLFYLTALILAIFLLIVYSTISFAIPKDYFVAMQLVENPNKWDIVMENGFEKSLAKYERKETLINFIKENKENYTGAKEVFIFSTVVLIFSIIGILRENKIKKP